MTRKQIEATAREHNVDESFIKGNNKKQLLWNIDRWWDGLLTHEIIASVAGNKSNKVAEYRTKRDLLRQALTNA